MLSRRWARTRGAGAGVVATEGCPGASVLVHRSALSNSDANTMSRWNTLHRFKTIASLQPTERFATEPNLGSSSIVKVAAICPCPQFQGRKSHAKLDCGVAEPRLRAPSPQWSGGQGSNLEGLARLKSSALFWGGSVVRTSSSIAREHGIPPFLVFVAFFWITSCISRLRSVFTKAIAQRHFDLGAAVSTLEMYRTYLRGERSVID